MKSSDKTLNVLVRVRLDKNGKVVPVGTLIGSISIVDPWTFHPCESGRTLYLSNEKVTALQKMVDEGLPS